MKLELKGRQIAVFATLIVALIMLFLPGTSRTRYSFVPDAVAKAITAKKERVKPAELSSWIIGGKNDYLLIDIRPENEYNMGHIKGAKNIPIDKLLKRSTLDSEFNDGKNIVLYSNGMTQSSQALLVMTAAGINATILEGGFNYWNEVILNPAAPAGQSDDEILRYNASRAVADFHGGSTKAGDTKVPEIKSGEQNKPVMKPAAGKKKLQGC